MSRLVSVTRRSGAGDRRRRAEEARRPAENQPPGEPPPRPEGEVAEPCPGREQLERPDSDDDRELPGTVDATEESEAVAVEDRRADHGLQQVIREGHASHGGQRTKRPAALTKEHHERGPAQRHEEIAPVVQLLADQREVQEIPAGREAAPDSKRVEQSTDPEPECSHARVKGSRTHSAENASLEEAHP